MDKIKNKKKTEPITDEEWEIIKKESFKKFEEEFKKVFSNNDPRFAPEPLDNKNYFTN